MECTESSCTETNCEHGPPQPQRKDSSSSRHTDCHQDPPPQTAKESPQPAKTPPHVDSAPKSPSSMSMSQWTRSSWQSSTGLDSTANPPADVRYESHWHQSVSVERTRTEHYSDTRPGLVSTNVFRERPSRDPSPPRKRLSKRLKKAVQGFFTKQSDAEADTAHVEEVHWTEL